MPTTPQRVPLLLVLQGRRRPRLHDLRMRIRPQRMPRPPPASRRRSSTATTPPAPQAAASRRRPCPCRNPFLPSSRPASCSRSRRGRRQRRPSPRQRRRRVVALLRGPRQEGPAGGAWTLRALGRGRRLPLIRGPLGPGAAAALGAGGVVRLWVGRSRRPAPHPTAATARRRGGQEPPERTAAVLLALPLLLLPRRSGTGCTAAQAAAASWTTWGPCSTRRLRRHPREAQAQATGALPGTRQPPRCNPLGAPQPPRTPSSSSSSQHTPRPPRPARRP